ncbi:hypothetical protein B0O99DRAFT_722146 [Bisporella sp. PMI_857]|nr:hypothetical protein B0O99DRAFT_722146 [Bisporella sp. PMI_857]
MTDIVDLRSSNLDAPRSPVSISTDSSGRGSLKLAHSEKHLELSSPVSPPLRLTRKRAASLNTESADLPPRIGDLALNSAASSEPPTTDLAREQVCLCQPDPKIPRPRNAFILFRQHYQAQVAAQHPGLANPEISKIIGEQWREQAPGVKDNWKRLAEEEKQRHQRQYPGYRYQPRRAGKPQNARLVSTSSTDDLTRCPKCNGRYISTSITPLTPFTPYSPAFGASQRNEHLLPPFTPTTQTQASALERLRLSSQKQNSRMDSPRIPPPHQQSHRRPPHPRPQPLHAHHEQEEDMELLSPSPDQKRRRFTNEPPPQRGYATSPISFSPPQPFSRNGPPMSATYRQQLPGPGMLVRAGNMGPLPQSPMTQQSRYQYSTRSGVFDESLRLPPLQTQIVRSIEHRDSQALGVEAMIMTIPFLNKIRMLHKIAPPLRTPGLASPSPEVRGAVVAIEGTEKALLAEIGNFLIEYLSKDPSCAVQTWTTSKLPSKHTTSPAGDTEMSDAATSSSKSLTSYELSQDPFVEYLSVVLDWHSKSQDIARYIITPPTTSFPMPLNPAITSTTINPKIHKPKILPIALLPHGFSITTSDDFAKHVPINDEYSPVDHWQWMATLWRGIIGPDVTVYTMRTDRMEIENFGSVQVIREHWSIILRLPESGKMDETTARRLGFEVLEMAIKVEERQRKLVERRAAEA